MRNEYPRVSALGGPGGVLGTVACRRVPQLSYGGPESVGLCYLIFNCCLTFIITRFPSPASLAVA